MSEYSHVSSSANNDHNTLYGEVALDVLQKAKELLLMGKSILSVADLVGFNSSSYFSRSFKSTFEQSPSEFIQEKVTC